MLALLLAQAPVVVPLVAPAPDEGRVLHEVLVKLRPGAEVALVATDPRVEAARRTLPAPKRDDRVGLARIHTLSVVPGTEAQVARALAGRADVEWAEVNTTGGGVQTDDTFYSFQWPLEQPNDIDVDMPEAWAFRGTDQVDATIRVGVIDSGFPESIAIADLLGALGSNPGETVNGVDDDGNGFVDDVHGYDFVDDESDPDGGHHHGIWMTSLMSSIAGNASGLAGCASGMQVVHARAFGDDGNFPSSGPYAGKVAAAAAITYMVDLGVELVNNSWADETGPTQVILDALDYAADNGVHMVFGAGNQNITNATPADHPDVIAVAGIDSSGIKSTFSNWGPWVDLSAAATDVAVLDPDFGAALVSGTSASAPHVTAIIAHLLSEDRDLTTKELRALLAEASTDLDALNPAWVGQLGAGHVNALASLERLATVEDVGAQLAGNSAPVLNAWGTTLPGDPLTLSLSRAEPSSLGVFVVGVSQLDLPLLSGTLVPNPNLLRLFGTNADGEHVKAGTLAGGLGAGVSIWVQMLVFDPGAPEEWSFSNAVKVTGA